MECVRLESTGTTAVGCSQTLRGSVNYYIVGMVTVVRWHLLKRETTMHTFTWCASPYSTVFLFRPPIIILLILGSPGNEWKTRYETQVDLNGQLKRQTTLLHERLEDLQGNPVGNLPYEHSSSFKHTPITSSILSNFAFTFLNVFFVQIDWPQYDRMMTCQWWVYLWYSKRSVCVCVCVCERHI